MEVIRIILSDYLRKIGAWETHRINPSGQTINQHIVHKIYHNKSGDYDFQQINRTTKINLNGILIEYEGEDSGIGLLFASKAAVQVSGVAVRGRGRAGSASHGPAPPLSLPRPRHEAPRHPQLLLSRRYSSTR